MAYLLHFSKSISDREKNNGAEAVNTSDVRDCFEIIHVPSIVHIILIFT